MKVSFSVVMIWSIAVSLSAVLSSIICYVTLKPKYKKRTTILGYLFGCILGFLLAFQSYSYNITNDLIGIIGTSIIVWVCASILGEESVYENLFVSIMATLMSNVATFFLCGTTLSFIDNASYPYNHVTITKFIIIKIVWFSIIFLIYNNKIKSMICMVLDTLKNKISTHLPVSLISFFGFYSINMITNELGVFPAIPDMRYKFIIFYGIICVIFIFEYYQIVSSVFWSSIAHKTEVELSVASKIQKDMLPCIFPPFPERNEFDIYAMMRPAKEVGGDFYDFFLIDKDNIGVVIADVSGKGVPAALFMVIAKTLIKNQSQSGLSPKDVFTKVNGQLCENNESFMFVTSFMGILEINTGKFTYVNAGHNPPLLKNNDEGFKFIKSKSGFVLAGMEGVKYKEYEMYLKKGDLLYLYTDGVTEATNIHNELYGEDRLLEVLNINQNENISSILDNIERSIDIFAKDMPQFDDITMLVLKFNAEGEN